MQEIVILRYDKTSLVKGVKGVNMWPEVASQYKTQPLRIDSAMHSALSSASWNCKCNMWPKRIGLKLIPKNTVRWCHCHS